MKKIIEMIYNNRKAFIIITILVIILFIVLLALSSIRNKTFSNNYYTFNYDSKWRISKKSDSLVKLKNGSKATLDIEIVQLEDENKYADLADFIDNIVYEIGVQNKDYNLIASENCKVTKLSYSGYKYLYENGSSQAMVTITKIGDKVIVFNYEAKNKYFDLILDSVQSIMYSFKLKPEKFNVSSKVSVDTKKISYSKNDKLSKKINKTKSYEIASSNYYVKYEIADVLTRTTLFSNGTNLEYKEGTHKIGVDVNIIPLNVYEYVEKDYVFEKASYVKEDPEQYTNYSSLINDFNVGKYKGYIYQQKYTINDDLLGKYNVEKYVIVLSLNKNHLLQIEISGVGMKVPKELIDSIKIDSVKNYSSYINREVKDGKVSVELKRFTSYEYKDIEKVKITLPKKYKEVDKQQDFYSNRNFGLNYDSLNEVYQYDIHYELTTLSKELDSIISIENSSINSYNEPSLLTYVGELTLNGKTYSLYDGYYSTYGLVYAGPEDSIAYRVNEKLLVQALDNGGYLVITIKGNNVVVDASLLNELTDYEISK